MIGLHRWWRHRALERAREKYDHADWRAAWEQLPLLDGLTSDEATSLCDLAVLFLRDKAIEAAQDIQLTDRMRLTIALQACLPILHLGLQWYSDWYAVILYPAEFRPKHEQVDEDGLVWVDDQPMSGEAWERGPVILSWDDVIAGTERDGYNLVIHEFAHKLDMRDGVANGHPPLHADMNDREWAAAWSAAYDDLCQRVDAGDDTDIDPYGAESPAEFFAVCSEAFFEIPTRLRNDYPRVYEQLARFYRQDPAARFR